MKFFPHFFIVLAMTSIYAADPIEFKVGEFTFQRPESWTWIAPSSAMRKAQLNIASPNGSDAAEVTFFYFGAGQGGSIQANVERWFGQFQNAQMNQHEEIFGKTKVVFVEVSGTFQSGMPGGPAAPKENYALRGAILQNAKGDVFVKLTGPSATVLTAEPAFSKMIQAAALNFTKEKTE